MLKWVQVVWNAQATQCDEDNDDTSPHFSAFQRCFALHALHDGAILTLDA
jgi:hypothetical protein